MNFIKKNWKIIVIVILAILFVSKCTSSGNYKRKYNKQVQYTNFVLDSMNTVYSHSSKYIDSLKNVIALDEKTINSLEERLNDAKIQNEQLAKKPVIVNVEKEEK